MSMKDLSIAIELRGFNKSWLLAVFRRLWDFLPPSVWIAINENKNDILKKFNNTDGH